MQIDKLFIFVCFSYEIEASGIQLISINGKENLRHLEVKYHTFLSNLEQEGKTKN